MNKIIFIVGVENFERSEWTVSKLSKYLADKLCCNTNFAEGFCALQQEVEINIEGVYILNEMLSENCRYYIVPEME